MSDKQEKMEGISTPVPEDPDLVVKLEWIETLTEEMETSDAYATSEARRREVLAEHYDDVLRHEGFASPSATPLINADVGMDIEGQPTEQPTTPTPLDAKLAGFKRKRTLVQSMRFDPDPSTSMSNDEIEWDKEDAQRVANSGQALPASNKRQRISKPVPLEEKLGDLPEDQPTLLHNDLPNSLLYRDEGDKPRERSSTAFTFMAKSYLAKGRGKNRPPAEKTNKMPPPVYMQQTEFTRGLLSSSNADDVATTDYDFFKFPDPDGEDPTSDKNLGWFRLNPTPQGPHSVAFIALATAMRKRKQAKDSRSSLGEKIQVVRLQIDEMIAVGHIPPPKQVRQILLEEESALFQPGSSASAPAFADGADEERKKRVTRYANTYTEYYNQLIALISRLASGGPTDWKSANDIDAALEAAYDRAEQLLNLHPYQSYGWRAGDPVVVGQEMGGKGESAAKDRLFGDTPEGEDDPLKYRLTGMAKVVDGWDPDRMARNPDRYRAFLIQRISFLLGDYASQMTGKPLEACELDELYNMMLDQNLIILAEKEAAQSSGL
jgi:hypothetical protein